MGADEARRLLEETAAATHTEGAHRPAEDVTEEEEREEPVAQFTQDSPPDPAAKWDAGNKIQKDQFDSRVKHQQHGAAEDPQLHEPAAETGDPQQEEESEAAPRLHASTQARQLVVEKQDVEPDVVVTKLAKRPTDLSEQEQERGTKRQRVTFSPETKFSDETVRLRRVLERQKDAFQKQILKAQTELESGRTELEAGRTEL